MKILLLTAEHGFGFINQADALAKGLNRIGVVCHIEKIHQNKLDQAKLVKYHPDFIISIGDWHDVNLLLQTPLQAGFPVIPWLVADDKADEWVSAYNQIPLVLSTSEHVKQTLIAGGIKSSLIDVLPEAVDDSIWKSWPDQKRQDFLQLISVSRPDLDLLPRLDLERAIQEHIPIIFTTGGYATAKGAQEVMRALAEIDQLPWIYIIKTWPSTEGFRHCAEEMALADELGISNQVRYIVGEFAHDFIVGLISICDIYAAPSRHEGFGLPLVEAQMCGKPVVSVAATAVQETVIHGQTGWLAKVDPDAHDTRAHVGDLSDYLKRLISNKAERESMGKKAAQHAYANYRPEVIAKRLLEIIATKYPRL